MSTKPRGLVRKSAAAPAKPGASTAPGRSNARRALSHVGGDVRFRGALLYKPIVDQALRVSADENAVRQHIHGFHSYPARLHPQTAHALIEALSIPGDTVLDPFCGSGTVLIEALALGRAAVGTDINPLSVSLSKLKTSAPGQLIRGHWSAAAQKVAEVATERRTKKAGPTRRYPAEDLQLFDIHVLLELDGLSAGIQQLEDSGAKSAMKLVLSSLLTKMSKRQSDSSRTEVERRRPGGFATRMFLDRTRELCTQMAEFESLLPCPPRVKALVTDARELAPIKSKSVDLIVCSPPYPGVYDYFDHHRARLRWLGLGVGRFESREIGSRRQLTQLDAQGARNTWLNDLLSVLRATARVLRPGAHLCCVVADVAMPGLTLLGDESVAAAAVRAGLEVVAVGSQSRPQFYRRSERAFAERERAEHLLILQKPAAR